MLNKQFSKSKNSFLISFEGGEGSGKSTQITLLKNYLLKKKIKVISTREPGGTIEAEKIRKLLVSGSKKAWDSYSEALIFNAIRREHINKVILPALNNGVIVLCDRFIDSTIVYQGLVGHVDEKKLLDLHKNYCYDLYPDLTFILDIIPQKGLIRALNRKNSSENRFENLGIEYHQKILNGFQILYKRNLKRIIKIDANQSKKTISNNINIFIKKLLKINDYTTF